MSFDFVDMSFDFVECNILLTKNLYVSFYILQLQVESQQYNTVNAHVSYIPFAVQYVHLNDTLEVC